MSVPNASNSSTLGNVLWNWVSNTTASNSIDLATQITCYAFPYGGLGFVAHLVMFYGIALSSLNKCPWRPSKPLKHSGWDMILGIFGLVISCLFAAVTLYRCSGALQYVLIASSKIGVTFTSSAIGLHIAWNIRGRKEEGGDQAEAKITHHNTLRWYIVEFLGSIVELTGVGMVLKEEHQNAVDKKQQSIMIISLVFTWFFDLLLGIGIIWLEVHQ